MDKTENNRCPTCGAELDCAVVYPDGEAFCMECGEVFNMPSSQKILTKKS